MKDEEKQELPENSVNKPAIKIDLLKSEETDNEIKESPLKRFMRNSK